ncbi:MAG: Maf family protein [Janthinobacterium lividum]
MILASQSAARASLLRGAGLTFEQRPARIDEASVKESFGGTDPEDCALMLASLKAARIRTPDTLIIGADQLLVCNDEWFDKPPDLPAARDQLQRLRGQTHTLVTALVCHKDGAEVWRHVARPKLRMRQFSDGFLDDYLAMEGDAVLSSVGAYRLEGPGIQLFDAIDGEYAAILGLPLLALLGFLRQHDVLRT